MKSTSQLETDLRSWALRRPSEKVKQSLFGREKPIERHSRLPAWGWLAPVAACLFVALAAMNQRDFLLQPGKNPLSVATVASNQSFTISSSNTFEWTREANITSSVRSQLIVGTNN